MSYPTTQLKRLASASPTSGLEARVRNRVPLSMAGPGSSSSVSEDLDTPLIEHATMTLAAKCRTLVVPTRSLAVDPRHAVAVRQFDRQLAACTRVSLRAVGWKYGYRFLPRRTTNLAVP